MFRPRERDHCLTCVTVSVSAFTVETRIILIQHTLVVKTALLRINKHKKLADSSRAHHLIFSAYYSFARTFSSDCFNWNVTLCSSNALNLQCDRDGWSFHWESQCKFQAASCAPSSHSSERLKCWQEGEQLLWLPLDAPGTQAYIPSTVLIHSVHTLVF